MVTFPPTARSSIESGFARFLSELEFYRLFLYAIVTPEVRVTRAAMEKRMLLEALAVKVHASWEGFVRGLMVDCLSCDTAQYAQSMAVTVPEQPSRDLCELMLTGTGILRLGNASQLRGIARDLLMPAFNPFKEIGKADVSAINEFQTVRNHIAHQSRQSRRGMERVYQRSKLDPSLPPGDFLATSVNGHGSADTAPRLGIYLDAFLSAAETMEAHLFPERQPKGTTR